MSEDGQKHRRTTAQHDISEDLQQRMDLAATKITERFNRDMDRYRAEPEYTEASEDEKLKLEGIISERLQSNIAEDRKRRIIGFVKKLDHLETKLDEFADKGFRVQYGKKNKLTTDEVAHIREVGKQAAEGEPIYKEAIQYEAMMNEMKKKHPEARNEVIRSSMPPREPTITEQAILASLNESVRRQFDPDSREENAMGLGIGAAAGVAALQYLKNKDQKNVPTEGTQTNPPEATGQGPEKPNDQQPKLG